MCVAGTKRLVLERKEAKEKLNKLIEETKLQLGENAEVIVGDRVKTVTDENHLFVESNPVRWNSLEEMLKKE